jgi:phospholipase C
MDQFFEDAKGPEPEFPRYSFIEPRYFHIPTERPQDDDHPPHSTFPAQALLADVYNALINNGALWESSLLVVVYDEHGGFFDHVVPPPAIPPDQFVSKYDFRQYGLRVPALLVSPWTEQRVLSTPFDHTSILKYAIDKWDLRPLTDRVLSAISIAEAISVTSNPRRDTPGPIQMPHALMQAAPGAPVSDTPVQELNENQKALLGFSKYLESQTPVAVRATFAAAASPNPAHAARERVAAYLAHKKTVRAP